MLCHVFVFFPVVSRSFVPPFFLCREIPENVLVDNYWRFHTSNFNSRESNFYDSHAQRERTLAWSEKHHRRVAVGGERGLTHWHIFNFCWSQFFLFFWGGGVSKYRCRGGANPLKHWAPILPFHYKPPALAQQRWSAGSQERREKTTAAGSTRRVVR